MSSETTENIGLHKWVGTDYVKMDEFNDNFEKIDQVAGDHAEQLADETQQRQTIDSQKADQDYVSQLLSMIGSGGPKELFYSISALNTKYPTGTPGPMLVLDSSFTDGAHVMMWDGEIWANAGLYLGSSPEDGSITAVKFDYALRAKIIQQLVNNIKMTNSTTNIVSLNSLSVEFTATTTYACLGFSVKNINGHKYRAITTIENIGTGPVTVNRLIQYNDYLSADHAVTDNGAVIGGTDTVLAAGSSQTFTDIFTTSSTRSAVSLGVLVKTVNGIVRVTQNIYDVTYLSDADAARPTFQSSQSSYFILSDRAHNADEADHAAQSDTATQTANAKIPITDMAANIAGAFGFAATITSTDPETKTIEYTLSQTYGSVGIPVNIETGKSYLVIFKRSSSTLNSLATMTTGSAWATQVYTFKDITINDETYTYALITVGADYKPNLYLRHSAGAIYGTVYTISGLAVYRLDEFNTDEITDDVVENILSGDFSAPINIAKKFMVFPKILMPQTQDIKNVLVVGDSMSASHKWPNVLIEKLGVNVTYHTKGGLGIVQIVDGDNGLGGQYDNTTDAQGVMRPLSTDEVTGIDLIIFFAGYNDRGNPDGQIGDVYNPIDSSGLTIAGKLQYAINRIYQVLSDAGNLKCKLLIVSPHCGGKYPYIDADGYQEWPAGSGYTLETLVNTMVKVGNYNNVSVCDLWHNSGIGKFTWPVYAATPGAVADSPITGTPYPNNADQLHLSDTGQQQIGSCIAGYVLSKFGN